MDKVAPEEQKETEQPEQTTTDQPLEEAKESEQPKEEEQTPAVVEKEPEQQPKKRAPVAVCE